MISLIMKFGDDVREVKIKEEVLFNYILIKHQDKIKHLIKNMDKKYKISDSFFTVINKYVEFDKNNVSIYPGLIVRTNIDDYAILYLENVNIDLDYAKNLIIEYSKDQSDYNPKSININEFEITTKDFLKVQHLV